MNRLFSLLLLGVALAEGVLEPPSNIRTTVQATSVELLWDPVSDATGYMVKIENITGQTTQSNKINIGGLSPRTMYTAMIKSMMDDEVSEPISVSFKTLVEAVQNIKVMVATETTIEISWNPIMDATSYDIDVESSKDNSTEMDLNTGEATIIITGLARMTFYDIFITAVTPEGTGETTMFKTRTDGSGVMIEGVWKNGNKTFGGQMEVFRPLVVPKGAYSIRITISCPISTIDVWGGNLIDQFSDMASGIVVVSQEAQWQRAKTEIGMNFLFADGVNCTFGIDVPEADFGINIPSNITESVNPVPIIQVEWVKQETEEVYQGGLVRFRLSELFTDPNEETEDETSKPPDYSFIIALNSGPNCPSGVNVRSLWGMSLKNTEGIAGTLPGYKYFAQEGVKWYSNEAGFLYGYNPETCPDRSGMTADVMVGGTLVNAVCNSPDVEMA